MDWRQHAACAGHDPELFFPVGTSEAAFAQAEQAKAICRGCAVSDECLQWAVETNQDVGIWGGLTEDQRRRLHRSRQRRQRAAG